MFECNENQFKWKFCSMAKSYHLVTIVQAMTVTYCHFCAWLGNNLHFKNRILRGYEYIPCHFGMIQARSIFNYNRSVSNKYKSISDSR